ncbi:hypothetical protein LOTGIDRAFT_234488 [Lottia gigantea]|uniref:Uncharacterized protein n=1 Tax=Lottia gigantea TaxID=225164 RepID=V4A0I0_LOTGI|nr:hypothetical protein LOTGIDRAFT_234488 [Lottia gigantea]ESO88395.1 hypothetical protein LOTGIDRAFT_234488 [Lottia gigantea]
MYPALIGIALTCMLVGLGESTNCQVGNCGCNKKTINVNKPGLPARNLDVCCPPSGSAKCSKYLRAASANATKGAFCTCDFIRVVGTCLKGEQCNPLLHPAQAHLNGMPICCQSASDKLAVNKIVHGGKVSFACQCAPRAPWTGDCWQGSQCNSCDPGYVGSANGLKLCCANCQKKGLIINAGSRECNCNN